MIDWPVFALILFAASLHASWNAFLKGSGDTLLSTTTPLVMGGAALIAVAALPFLPAPGTRRAGPISASRRCCRWPILALLVRVYGTVRHEPCLSVDARLRTAGGRARQPLLAWRGWSRPAPGSASARSAPRRSGHDAGGTRIAASGRPCCRAGPIGATIAAYTLIDGTGARASGAPAPWTLWLSPPTGLAMVIWTVRARGTQAYGYVRKNWPIGLFGGLGTIVSYSIALWAMTMAPIAMVAALRETSILFATGDFSACAARAGSAPRRIAAAVIIACGSDAATGWREAPARAAGLQLGDQALGFGAKAQILLPSVSRR
jgi:hypothetical protein